MLFEFQVSRDPQFGGILGVYDFPASAVRHIGQETDAHPLCMVETPLDLDRIGNFERPSHADIVNSKAGMTDEERKASRETIYNQIKLLGSQLHSEQVTDVDLVRFIPIAAFYGPFQE